MLENHISSLFQYSFSVSQCHMSEMYIFQEYLSHIAEKTRILLTTTPLSLRLEKNKVLCHVHLERWVVIMGKNSRNGYH